VAVDIGARAKDICDDLIRCVILVVVKSEDVLVGVAVACNSIQRTILC
jgi:hypothetical protein